MAVGALRINSLNIAIVKPSPEEERITARVRLSVRGALNLRDALAHRRGSLSNAFDDAESRSAADPRTFKAAWTDSGG